MDPSEKKGSNGRSIERSNSQSSLHKGHMASHRQSFVENQRHPPPANRDRRHPSATQQAIQDLLNRPPTSRQPNPRFAGRDWRGIALGELVSQDDVKWADMGTSVEEATMTLLRSNPSNVVLVRETPSDNTAVSTFDYSDLNSYLLVVVGLSKPDDEHAPLYHRIADKAQAQEAISLREIQPLCHKEELITLSSDSTLDRAMEIFGSGIHLVLVAGGPSSDVVGVTSQLKLLEFFWNEGINFPAIDRLYGALLRDLQIGTHQTIAINADAPLADALTVMHDEGLNSVAVVDNGLNVVGNISAGDLRHLTSAASMPLLKNSCMHFISVILSERGVERGRDSFPVFYVNPYSTLAHTVAKLVATQSHRMWVVESASPSPSAPATPLLAPSLPHASTASSAAGPPATTNTSGSGSHGPSPSSSSAVLIPTTSAPTSPPQPSPLPGQTFPSVPASALPGARISGRLTGVVSLTDILNLFARSTGLNPADPSEQRARRRRSSSSSVRPSLDGGRSGIWGGT